MATVDRIVRLLERHGPAVAMIAAGLGLMLAGVIDDGGKFTGLESYGLALVGIGVLVGFHIQARRDHAECLIELGKVREGAARAARYMATFRQALVEYFVSDETADDKQRLMAAIREGL